MAKLCGFPISFWYAPANTFENWQLAAACGFTVVPFSARDAAEGRMVLDWLQLLGMQGMLQDRRINPRLVDEKNWQETVRQIVADYSGHPALWGYFMTDEPRFSGIEKLGKLSRAFQAADPAHIAYSNLLPITCDTRWLETVDFKTYVREYIAQVKPSLLSYDFYGLREEDDNPAYFTNLEAIRAEALNAGVPFLNIFLSVPHFAYRDPSSEDLRWQVYTSLAYGAQAITYFTYLTPDIENYHEGITTIYNKPTEKFPAVRQLNLELQRLGPWLLGLTSVCVTHVGTAPAGSQRRVGSGSICEADGSGCDLLVGEFRDAQQQPWLMVVNKDRAHSAWVKCQIRGSYAQIHEVARSTGELRAIARDAGARAAVSYEDGMTVQFWLAPADGRLMRLSNHV